MRAPDRAARSEGGSHHPRYRVARRPPLASALARCGYVCRDTDERHADRLGVNTGGVAFALRKRVASSAMTFDRNVACQRPLLHTAILSVRVCPGRRRIVAWLPFGSRKVSVSRCWSRRAVSRHREPARELSPGRFGPERDRCRIWPASRRGSGRSGYRASRGLPAGTQRVAVGPASSACASQADGRAVPVDEERPPDRPAARRAASRRRRPEPQVGRVEVERVRPGEGGRVSIDRFQNSSWSEGSACRPTPGASAACADVRACRPTRGLSAGTRCLASRVLATSKATAPADAAPVASSASPRASGVPSRGRLDASDGKRR